MRVSALLVLAFATLAGAEVPQAPDAFWPLPSPDWMPDQETSVAITRVVPGMPSAAARLQVGDRVVSVGGLRVVSRSEFILAVRLAAARADNHGECLRAGASQAVRLPAFSAWARWGIELEDLPVPAPAWLAPERLPAWALLSVRVRQAGLRLAAGDAGLEALLALRQAAADGTAPGPVPVLADPYLQRVANWWRLCAAAGGAPAAVEDPSEALFRAAHVVWPSLPVPAPGAITTGSEDADRILAAMAGPTPPSPEERTAVASQLSVSGIPRPQGDAGTYLGQCLAAIIEPGGHGGWPYRSELVWERGARATMVAALAAEQDPALALVVALGRVGPAVIDGDGPALLAALDRLHQGSPWLAQRALRIAGHGARMWNRTPWLTTSLLAADSPVAGPAFKRRLRWQAQLGIDMDELLDSPAPEAVPALAVTWKLHPAWRAQAQVGRGLAAALNDLLWGMSTDPAGLDPENAVPLARQLVLADADGVPHAQVDTVAAAFARAGMKEDALCWQQAAIAQVRGGRMHDHDRKSLAEYGGHLAAIRRGEAVTKGTDHAATAQEEPVAAGRRRGSLIDGNRVGVWKTLAASGTVVEELGYRAGEPAGRWLARSADGTLRWSGFVAKEARLGWWRIATADGGTATGWYDGREGGARCGWWRIYDRSGALCSEGPCSHGQPIPPWRALAADGGSAVLPVAQVRLPADPPLPAAQGGAEAVSF